MHTGSFPDKLSFYPLRISIRAMHRLNYENKSSHRQGLFMDFCSLYAPRLQEERKRLGLSQDAAGSLCGVSREMWGKYERGKAAIASEALACFAQAGANVEYILTGDRAATSLTPDEQVLLDGYRALDTATRRRMLAFVLSGEPQTASGVADKYRGARIGGVNEGDFTGEAHIQVGGKGRK